MLHPVLAAMLLHLQRLCTLPGLSWREDKEDNWEALLQEDLQRRYDTLVGHCFQTVCVFCPLISYGFVLIFFFFDTQFPVRPLKIWSKVSFFF